MPKILVVDDELAILHLLKSVFDMEAFEVTTASSAREAIALLAPQKFDIVLTDLRMESPLAGFDLAAAANRLVPRPVIAILTAFPVPATDWKGAGADALLVKGAGMLNLPSRLRRLFEERSQSTIYREKSFSASR